MNKRKQTQGRDIIRLSVDITGTECKAFPYLVAYFITPNWYEGVTRANNTPGPSKMVLKDDLNDYGEVEFDKPLLTASKIDPWHVLK